MTKLTKILGTASVLAIATLAAGPAAAATLTDFAGALTTSYGHNDLDGADDAIHDWLLGGSVAGPLSDLSNLNFQLDASYDHNWADHFSEEVWNLGGSAFWAGMDGRIGINFNYETFTHFGHVTNGGVFGEWYFGNITAMAKGGWLSSGGSGFGGHGNYMGGAISGYFIPNLAITGGVEWTDIVTGFGCQVCGRSDVNNTGWEIGAEFLFSEDYGVSIFGNYANVDQSFSGEDFTDNVFRIGLRWYMGGGSLQDHHRNGNLNPWLPALGVHY